MRLLILLSALAFMAVQSIEFDENMKRILKRNVFNHGQSLNIEIAFSGEKAPLASFNQVPYVYEKGKKLEKVITVPVAELLKHKQFQVTVYSDAYKSFAQVKKMDGLPIQAPRQVYREFLNVTIHQEDSERSSTSSGILLRKRIELNLVHSENITNPNDQMLQWYPKGDDYFLPPLDTSQFWVLKPNFVDKANLKPEDTSINVTVVFELITPNSFMFTLGMRQNADSNPVFKTMGEQMKELLVNNSPEYLIFMVCATILHTIFQSLAMKNDFQYWNNVKNFEGVSLSTIWWDAFVSVLQILYFRDIKFEGMPLYFVWIGAAMSAYRVFKVHYQGLSPKFPFVKFTMPESYSNKTQAIEKKVIRVQMYVIIPCLIIYMTYNYINSDPQPALYSFILKMLMVFVASFGFVQMTPQIYINYIHRSVPVMPWRTMVYKFLDATIDDIFTVAMKAPTLTMLMHLTDDAVLVILMVQRWMYKVDANRTEMGHLTEEQKKAIQEHNTKESKQKDVVKSVKEKDD